MIRSFVRHFSAPKIKRGKTLYAYKLPLPEYKAEVRTRLTKASPVAPDPDVGAELARRRNDTIFIVQGAVFRHDRLSPVFLSSFFRLSVFVYFAYFVVLSSETAQL